jgi:hypothetical protein
LFGQPLELEARDHRGDGVQPPGPLAVVVVEVGVLTSVVVVVVGPRPVESDSVVGVVDGSVDVGVIVVGAVGPVVVVVGTDVGGGAPG